MPSRRSQPLATHIDSGPVFRAVGKSGRIARGLLHPTRSPGSFSRPHNARVPGAHHHAPDRASQCGDVAKVHPEGRAVYVNAATKLGL